ncbi:hypothetical protein GIB67_042006 [Kingdonia uniflora]|uniref:Aminotransferase-like plant mobile domain-containing protein n=1 Tax=Kingdonia uniflora TaxID=39325 RepID=A0A7J7P010_9MAGN|nr:hypothetical protein GIB67_042006 [Kingdonia uniflora]
MTLIKLLHNSGEAMVLALIDIVAVKVFKQLTEMSSGVWCKRSTGVPMRASLAASVGLGRETHTPELCMDLEEQEIQSVLQLLPNIDSSHIKSGNVSIAHLRTYLTVTADREDDITIARVFILFMMGHLWFQTANDTIPLGYLTAVNDLDSVTQYDWGYTILASLYHGLDTAVATGGAITRFVQLLLYWFYEYCGVGHPIVKEEVKCHIDHRTVKTITWEPWFDSAVFEIEDVLNAKLISRKRMPLQVPNENYKYYLGDRCWRQVIGQVRILLDPPLNMLPHISPVALHEMRQARMGNLDLFGPTALKAGIIPVVVTSTSVHSLSQDFSLLGEVEGPDLGWHMEWTGRRERLPIACLRDPSSMSLSYGAKELWHLTHGMQ